MPAPQAPTSLPAVRRAVRPRAAGSWAALYGAIVLDVVQVLALDGSDGFADPLLAGVAVTTFAAELYLLSVAVRRISTAVAYALYGLGTVGVAVISIGWLGEPLTPVKAVALLTVIVGAVLLNLDGTRPPVPAARAE